MPREVFVAGQVLTAGELNVVSDQSVMVFAGTAARGSAIPSPTEGMVTYLSDSDVVQVFDGSSYKPVGGLVDVKSVLKTDTFSASVAAGSSVAVTDLSITHEVSDPANKLIISGFFGVSATSQGQGALGIAVHDGTSLIGIGDASGSRSRVTAGGPGEQSSYANLISYPSFTFVHTPGAGSKTYALHIINTITVTRTVYVNRGEQDIDGLFYNRGVSALTIQEVSV